MTEKFTAIFSETVDSHTLFFGDGSVNFDAVAEYLSSLSSDEDEGSRLTDISMESTSVSVDLNIDKSEPADDLDYEQWRQENPIDYAIYAYMVHLIRSGIEYSHAPTNTTIANNPKMKLDLVTEMDRYIKFAEQEQHFNFDFMKKANEFMGESPNYVDELECIVAIPVAGHQEYQNIYHSLEQFASQDLPHSKFEVVLYLNLPGKEGENDDELAENLELTTHEIDRFRTDYPSVVVRSVVNTYRMDVPVIGAIRADLWDVVAYDMKIRGRKDDILVVSSDADIISLNKVYLSDMVTSFKEETVDIVAAQLRWQPAPGLPYNSLVNRILRYQTFLDDVRDKHGKMVHTADANTGISLAAYLAVGGYNRSNALGEMRNLVNRIRYYRQDIDQRDTEEYIPPQEKIEMKAPNASLRTHSRRLLKAMELGYSPYHAWNQDLITFGTDDSVRTDAMRSKEANDSAALHARKWISEMTGPYVQDLDEDKKRRILKAAHTLLGFDELHIR